ncbi:MAG TPA: tripartite tricarboxylate transporter substrate-binding protein [Candidatus Binatia bacterium]|nr:tripartite tricarboxylate transporter substrate-binding protein [Candidatus Binatia bacterium]
MTAPNRSGTPAGFTFAGAILLLLLVFARLAHAQGEPFYAGKTVRIIVGFTPGGFYDRWARLLSRYMPKHLPGNPNFLVQNMPGASSVIAANYVYNLAKSDGLTLLVPINSLYLDQIVGRKEVKFDVRKFEFIGTQEKAPTMLYFRADSPFKTLGDIIQAKEPPKCGSTGTASTGYLIAKLLEEAFKAKLNTVTGYQGGSEIDVAVERGEIVCRGMDIPPHFGREPFDSWHKKGFDPHILQTSEKRDARTGDVPTIYEIFDKENTADESRRVADVILRGGDFRRPMIAPPGTPADRVNILREAYVKSMSNPELLAEAKKARMDVEPVTGEQLQALAKRVMNQPPAVLKRVKKILE